MRRCVVRVGEGVLFVRLMVKKNLFIVVESR